MVDIDYSRELSQEELSKLTTEQRRDYLDARKRMRNGTKLSDILGSVDRKAEPPVKENPTSETKEPKKQPKEKSVPQVKRDAKGRVDKGFGLNQDGTFRQKPNGRKCIPESLRKTSVHIMVRKDNIDLIQNAINENKMNDTVPHILSEYIAEHIEDILRELTAN